MTPLAFVFGLNRPASTTGDSCAVDGFGAHRTALEAYVLPLDPICTVVAADANVASVRTAASAVIPDDTTLVSFIQLPLLQNGWSVQESADLVDLSSASPAATITGYTERS
jgi:hypothetical protein